MKKIFYVFLLFQIYSVSAQSYDLKITPYQSNKLCLPISPTPKFDIEVISIDPTTRQPVIEITGYPTAPNAIPTYFTFRYRLIGANFVSSQTYTSPFYSAGYNGRVFTTIEPFIPLGGSINTGTTTLFIDQISYNYAPIDAPNPEVPRTYDVEILNPIVLSETDNIQGNILSLSGGNYNLNINTSLPNGSYIFYLAFSGANNNPYVFSFDNPPFYQVNVVSGQATISIPGSYLPNNGINTISLISVGNGTCTSSYLNAKTFTFTTVPTFGPDVTGSKTLTINPFCQGTNGIVQFTSSAVANGNYNINYTLSGSNNLASSSVAVAFSSGSTTFQIPSSQLPNSGSTTISIISISDGTGTSTYTPFVDYTFTINPIPNASGTNSIN